MQVGIRSGQINTGKGRSTLSEEISMSVSPAVSPKGEKLIYVLFTDGKKSAELTAPQGKVITNNGFDEEEIRKLADYVQNEYQTVLSLAKQVNPMRAFLDSPVRMKE